MLLQTDGTVEPISDLIQYGVIGLILLLTALGKIWWWPAVKNILDRAESLEKKLDRHQNIYESIVIPALKDSGDALARSNELLWQLSREIDVEENKSKAPPRRARREAP